MPVLVPEPVKIYAAESAADVQAAVANAGCLLVRGGGSKTALSRPQPGAAVLELARLAGILEYNPGEFVFTALAGTPLATIEVELAQHGQYLPFNPPLAGRGATLGGAVAAGLSGAGRQRYVGLRDFFIGARFVDGQGRLVRSGGKVVKNAAGFDQHKLLIGSLGRLGVLVELSFKVFPQPPAYGTLRVNVADAAAGVAVLRRLATTRFDLEALDLRVNDPTLFPVAGANGTAGAAVLVRLGGQAAVLPQRLQMLAGWLGAGEVDAAAEAEYWRAGDSFAWLPGGAGTSRSSSNWSLVKTPITLDRLAALDEMLAAHGATRRYNSGGNLAWIGWPRDLGDLDRRLADFGLGGLVVLGSTDAPLIGVRQGQNLAQRVKATLDPNNKFLALA
jgi:glycolate oxidase FAD binding subunit